jgi:hypothetical protein
LVVEAGPYVLGEHVQNAGIQGVGDAPGVSLDDAAAQPEEPKNEVWSVPWKSTTPFTGLAYCVGGRSMIRLRRSTTGGDAQSAGPAPPPQGFRSSAPNSYAGSPSTPIGSMASRPRPASRSTFSWCRSPCRSRGGAGEATSSRKHASARSTSAAGIAASPEYR